MGLDSLPGHVWVEFRDGRLCLTARVDAWGPCLALPDAPDRGSELMTLSQAVHARIHPLGTADVVLAGWARGEPVGGWVPAVDPSQPPPDRRRGAAVVLHRGRMLLVRYPPDVGVRYFVPGGGVEPGETPARAAERELREETGLAGTVARELAVIYNRGREEHYFLMSVDDPGPSLVPGDLAVGQTLEWVDIPMLPDTPVWPTRLAWRIAYWWRHDWPWPPAVLADSHGDLGSTRSW